MKPLCRHCERRKRWKSRGLCWGCFYTPGVKEMYPISSKYGKRGIITGRGVLAPRPTHAAPGTEEKRRVLSERAAAGYALFHPADAKYEGDLSPHYWQLIDTGATHANPIRC